jgi:hypothetical protein
MVRAKGGNHKKEEEFDIIAALDAQAEQIGDMLESRIDEIDAHWRHSGGARPGAVPKSGVKMKAGQPSVVPMPAEQAAVVLGAGAKAPAKAPPGALGAEAPPWRVLKQKQSKERGDEEDDDYDPFSELPVAEVSGDALVKDLVSTVQAMQEESNQTMRTLELVSTVQAMQEESNQTIRALQAMQAKLASADAKAIPIPPWRKKQSEYVMPASGVSLSDLKGNPLPPPPPPALDADFRAAVPQTKAGAPNCAVPISGHKRTSTRIDVASERAKKYFKPAADEKPAAKTDGASVGAGGKCKSVEAAVAFTQEVLDKAPATLQTCRSLLLFLNKKLEGPLAKAPSCGGPEDLRERLESYADDAGRTDGLRAGGWDARAKRIVDIGAVTKSSVGEALLNAADQALEKAKLDLEKGLGDRGEKELGDIVSERKKWAQENVRQDFYSWCAKVLRAREATLLRDGCEESNGAANTQTGKSGGLGPAGIFEAILSRGVSLSKAGG